MAAKKIVKRILKQRKKVKEPEKPQVQEQDILPAKQPEIPGLGCSVCGAPLAEGQTYVCIDHIRRG